MSYNPEVMRLLGLRDRLGGRVSYSHLQAATNLPESILRLYLDELNDAPCRVA